MHNPTVTKLESDKTRAVYRLEGGALHPAWAATLAPGSIPFCEITVYDGVLVGAFGGSVWPAAYPHLFIHGATSAQFPVNIRLSEEGQALLATVGA
jgi:hypothetical protein